MKLHVLSALFIITFLIKDVSCQRSPSVHSVGTPQSPRRFRGDLVNTEFRTGRAIDPRLYDLPSTRAPNQPAQNTNLKNDNSSENPLTDGNWFEMLVALSPLPHN
ncbi:hypothetical protein CRE_13496 [Caenorhabditis remanei]|uniref:Uncharacterized protein n=1 Tax=Caenorhabditis remanei TaxID=31234 RepID=E3MRA8_CAERE|nr:hypothetical protein CRE_13496 [Caenorhabditis remanei]